MRLLSKITPAETLLLEEPNAAKRKDLLKFTFMDLLLKKVIEIKEISKPSHPRDPHIRTYTYIVFGKNFRKYKPKNHELIFLSPFIKNNELQILFKHFIKMAFDASKGNWTFKKTIKNNNDINPYFKQSFFLNLFRSNLLTDKGIKVQKEVKAYLNEIDQNIGNLLHNDQRKGLELLLTIKGNIFLLKNLDFQLLKKIDKNLISEQKNRYNDFNESTTDWWYVDFFVDESSFGSHFDSFDNVLDSFDTQFEASSCSSCDSGCSGCGGCD